MFSKPLFNLISHLIFSRWVRHREAHHGAYEDAYAARVGPLHLEVNRCLVLDHDDAFISLCIPMPRRHAQDWRWGRLSLGYVVCLGADEIRQPGFYARWQPPLDKVVSGQGKDNPDDPIPF